MGWFSSKTKTYVGTSLVRVVADDQVPDSVKTGLARAMLESRTGSSSNWMNGNSINDHVLEDLAGGIARKAEKYYRYGKNGYHYSLPSGQVSFASEGQLATLAVLETIDGGAPLQHEYMKLGPPNSLHLTWMELIATHGYNPNNNQIGALTTLHGTPVYLDDIVIVMPAAQFDAATSEGLELWGPAPSSGESPLRDPNYPRRPITPVERSTTATYEYARIKHIRQVAPYEEHPGIFSSVMRGTFEIPIAGLGKDPKKDYIHVKYRKNTSASYWQIKYWLYEVGSGVHPTLDALTDVGALVAGTYFPFLHFRHNKVFQSATPGATSYLSAKKLAKTLGIDYDQISDSMAENPNIGDVTQAVMMLAVPPISTVHAEKRYLFDYFKQQYIAKTRSNGTLTYKIKLGRFDVPTDIQRTTIQDYLFEMGLLNQGMYRRVLAGTIAEPYVAFERALQRGIPYSFVDEFGNTQTTTFQQDVVAYCYQKRLTPQVYEEIQVINFETIFYDIVEGYNTTSTDIDEIRIVPLDRSITKTYSLEDKEQLYARSLHFVFNSVQYQKVKWYQTGIFQLLMIVIAVIVTIVTDGAAAGWAASIVGATAGLAYYLVIILINQLIGLVIGALVKLFVKAVGVEVTFLIALVAAMRGGYIAYNTGSIAGAPLARDLLQISIGLANAGFKEYLKQEMDALSLAYQEFNDYRSQIEKELDRAEDLLGNKIALSPFVIFGESPNDFYNRTIHSGNIGVMGLDAITNYVDAALSLPTIASTLGEVE